MGVKKARPIIKSDLHVEVRYCALARCWLLVVGVV